MGYSRLTKPLRGSFSTAHSKGLCHLDLAFFTICHFGFIFGLTAIGLFSLIFVMTMEYLSP
jgi:hypothetical protein